jgi:anti-sigma B factor antagonist
MRAVPSGVDVNKPEWTPASSGHVRDLRAAAAAPGGRRPDETASFGIQRHGDTVVLQVQGEIDMLTSPRLRKELVELLGTRPAALVLDLAGVSFFASSGLATLVEVSEAAAEAGVPLRLAAPGRSVRRPLQITGLAGRFETYDDVPAALRG